MIFSSFSSPAKRTKNANNATHYVKLGKKRRESSKRDYYIIFPRVIMIIKAIIISVRELEWPRNCYYLPSQHRQRAHEQYLPPCATGMSACERDLVMNEKNQFKTWFCNQTFETSVAPRVPCQLL